MPRLKVGDKKGGATVLEVLERSPYTRTQEYKVRYNCCQEVGVAIHHTLMVRDRRSTDSCANCRQNGRPPKLAEEPKSGLTPEEQRQREARLFALSGNWRKCE